MERPMILNNHVARPPCKKLPPHQVSQKIRLVDYAENLIFALIMVIRPSSLTARLTAATLPAHPFATTSVCFVLLLLFAICLYKWVLNNVEAM